MMNLAEALASGVLDPVVHAVLVQDLPRYADRAGIDPKYIWTSALTGFLTQNEISYLRRCRLLAHDHGVFGLCYAGAGDVTHKFSLMAGALVRAFVDARVMTAQQVLDEVKEGGHPEATVLLVPNFFSRSEFGRFDTSRAAVLGDLLCHRAARGEQTVIHVDSPEECKLKLGPRVAALIAGHMQIMS
jgi:hypothetical protein